MGRERRFIGYVGASGVGIRDGMGMGWDGQHKYHCGIAVPSHPIPSTSHMPIPFNPMTTLAIFACALWCQVALPIFKSQFAKAVAGELSELLAVSWTAKPVYITRYVWDSTL